MSSLDFYPLAQPPALWYDFARLARFGLADLADRVLLMAKCEYCGKHTTFGQNNPFSQKKTKRTFKPNLQKVRVMEQGRLVSRTLCAKCIKTLGKHRKEPRQETV
jgi:large subunit ribosomal protein L28